MQALMVSFMLLVSAWSVPEKLKIHTRPRRTVAGKLLPHNKLKVIRSDRTTQSLPRRGGNSLDAIKTEWEVFVLRHICRPGSKS